MRRFVLVMMVGILLAGMTAAAKRITWGEIRCLYNPRACLK